jgi:hypothetical protein
VWNRAAMQRGGLDARAGDQAVAAMLRFHSQAMGGGVAGALIELDPMEFDDTIDGYRYLGLNDAADTVLALCHEVDVREDDAFEAEANSRYAALVPRDAVLVAAFEQRFRERPDDFAPVE